MVQELEYGNAGNTPVLSRRTRRLCRRDAHLAALCYAVRPRGRLGYDAAMKPEHHRTTPMSAADSHASHLASGTPEGLERPSIPFGHIDLWVR